MNKRIYKYELQLTDMQEIHLPEGADILSVVVQPWNGDMIVLYAMVNIKNISEPIKYRIIGTGHPIEDDFDGEFIDTFVLPNAGLVFHVFIMKRGN